MPKRISAIDRQRLSLAHIVQRLPLHQRLSASNAAVIKLTPVWQRWAKAHVAKEFRSQIQLSCPNNDEMVLTCPHAVCASQLKHRKQNLLSFVQNSEVDGIKRIQIRIAKTTNQQGAETASRTQQIANSRNHLEPDNIQSNERDSQHADSRLTLSKESVQSIESCQRTVSNTRLADSLSQLAITLKNRANSESAE